MDLYQQHRVNLFNAFTKECNHFDHVLREELARRDDSATGNEKAVQAELASLRERALRAETLQQENYHLRVRLEAALSGRQASENLEAYSGVHTVGPALHGGLASNPSNLQRHDESSGYTSVPRETYDELAFKYHRLSQDFSTLQDARKALIAKWNKQKATIELWRIYTKKHLEKTTRRERRLDVLKGSEPKAAGSIPPSNPAQCINRATSPTESTGNGLEARSAVDEAYATSPMPTIPSRDISSVPTLGCDGLTQGFGDNSDHALDLSGDTNVVEEQPFKRYSSPQVTTLHTVDPMVLISPRLHSPLGAPKELNNEHVDAVELLPWDAQQSLRTSSTLNVQHQSSDATTDEGHQDSPYDLPALRPDTGEIAEQVPSPQLSSDPPVIVSERSLKRKRPVSNCAMIKANDEARPDGSGSAMKPIRVKSEQDSSSPIMAGLLRCQEGGESLDLDEVGDRVYTPRKRRRFQDLIWGSQRHFHLNPQDSIRPDQHTTGFEIAEESAPVDSAETYHDDHIYPQGRSSKGLAISAYKTFPKQGLSAELLNAKFESARKCDDAAMSFLASLAPAERNAILQEALKSMDAESSRRAHGRLPIAEHFEKLSRKPRGGIEARSTLGSPLSRGDHEYGDLVAPSKGNQCRGLPSSAAESAGSKQPSFETPAVPSLQRSESARRDAATTSSRVLHPRNLNTKVLPRTSGISAKDKPRIRKERDSAAARIPAVAEDGEGNYANRRLKSASASTGVRKKDIMHDSQSKDQSEVKANLGAHQRLGNLLEEPLPEKRLLPKGARSGIVRSGGYCTPGKDSPKFQALNQGGEVDKGSNVTPLTRLSSSTNARKKASSPQRRGYTNDAGNPCSHNVATGTDGTIERAESVRPEDEPFRARPLRRLGLEHFKINPEYNQGLDYAFVETVRNREQRQCLPGCTRPECCGDKFRKLVKIGGAPTPQRPGIWDSSQVDEDQRLLEQYLGDDRGRLEAMNDEEKDELLMQAKTKQFADKHGKHRHAYERRTTPPGFWRTDMPTTQETGEDREKAKEMERQKVEERYREAMRPGGRWLFRDE
ncbi:MAG: hypothetical protein M1835_007989 [Candelina submexicana]|nr:MAG: hypothetical protein M1835_007989 [Candelina submexicana]